MLHGSHSVKQLGQKYISACQLSMRMYFALQIMVEKTDFAFLTSYSMA
jgi:hypothetical protein